MKIACGNPRRQLPWALLMSKITSGSALADTARAAEPHLSRDNIGTEGIDCIVPEAGQDEESHSLPLAFGRRGVDWLRVIKELCNHLSYRSVKGIVFRRVAMRRSRLLER